MKKILLLGGSAQQVVAIQKAKSLGYYTVLCDYLPDNPGQYEADAYYNVSTTDVEAVYQVALKEKVDGVLAYASDPAALPAAIVAERLGLPTNPVSAVEILGVKYKFRKFMAENQFACPRHFPFTVGTAEAVIREKLKDLHFPWVIKPTDSSGSKGVTVLQDADGLTAAITWAAEFSRNKVLIAEEFIKGDFPDVIGGDIFVWDNKIVFYGLMACLRSRASGGLIPVGEKNPSGLSLKQTEAVRNELQRMVTLAGIRFGELNVEILLGKNDDVHFLELGPRAGGNMIPIQLSDIYGIDLVTANVQAAMGKNPNLHPIEKDGSFITYVLHSEKEGTFSGIYVSEKIAAHVYRQCVYKKLGDKIEAFDGAGKAIGVLFLHFDTDEDMAYFANHHEELVRVEV